MGLAADLADIAKPIATEAVFAHHESPVPAAF
jgi:hypothetical protein